MQTYQVVGPRRYAGHEPGATFSAEIEPALEEALILAGHLEIVPPETFACETCAAVGVVKEYATVPALKGHMTREHPERSSSA